MADFKPAFDITMGHEGGYANDPDDAGGETYRGIARRYHPSWKGWLIIDQAKLPESQNLCKFPKNLASMAFIAQLNVLVRDLYQDTFWNPMLLNEVPSQPIANEMFDTGVNMSTTRAVTFLQRSLNVMNRDGRTYPDLVEDGVMGPTTLKALKLLLSVPGEEELLLTWMNVCQGQHYMEYMKKSPTQEKFARSWVKRVSIKKEK